MSPQESSSSPVPTPAGLAPREALLAGWLAAGLLNAVVFAVTCPRAPLGFGQRLQLHAYEFTQTTLIAVVVFALSWGYAKWLGPRLGVRSPWVGRGLVVLVVGAFGAPLLADDLGTALGRALGAADSRWLRLLGCAVLAELVPLSFVVGRWFARGAWRAVPLLTGLGSLALNHLVLRGDYPAVHLLLGAIAATTLSSAAAGSSLRLPLRGRRVAFGVLAVSSVFFASVRPPGTIAPLLAHAWSQALSPVLPRSLWGRSSGGSDGHTVFEPGLAGGPVPPTSRPLLEESPVVIFLGVDSLRADLLGDAYAERYPELHRLRNESTWFSRAWSPGTQTAITLTSVMTGTYYSQQYWSLCFVPEGTGVRVLFAHEDPTPRFPELLSQVGVPTVQYGQAVWLLNRFGMTRGFSEERIVEPVKGRPSTKGKWSTGDDVLPLIQERLRRHGGGPLFLFFHDLDPHAPFDLGEVKSPAKQAYLSEIEHVDRRLGELRRTLEETGLAARTVLIVTADHGEAFGEHGTSFHGQNLYEEQVRVPLLVHVPNQAGRVVELPVTLMDLGPTILDVFRQPTPPHFMGQSLVPVLQGRAVEFTRPIVSEGRLKQSMVLPSGLKLIKSQREGTLEIYDLANDPTEQRNLYDQMGPAGAREMQKLDAFFERHRIRRPGYEIPYRR